MFELIPTNGWVGAAWASLISDGALALLIWIIIFLSSQTMLPLLMQKRVGDDFMIKDKVLFVIPSLAVRGAESNVGQFSKPV